MDVTHWNPAQAIEPTPVPATRTATRTSTTTDSPSLRPQSTGSGKDSNSKFQNFESLHSLLELVFHRSC